MTDAETKLKNQQSRSRGRPFPKGKSGNPKGKPPGTRCRTTIIAQELLDGEAETLVRKVIDQALEGDSTCLRLCLERILPPRKEVPVSITLPKIKSVADITKLISSVMAELSSGALTPTEAKAVSDLAEVFRKALETVELEPRIRALEEQSKTKRISR